MADEARSRFAGRGRWIAIGALILVAAVALFWWRTSGRQSTDDAQVDGHITQVAPRVGGTVVQLNVLENQRSKPATCSP
jgi:membrane fusion protein (multidrug efflux system)